MADEANGKRTGRRPAHGILGNAVVGENTRVRAVSGTVRAQTLMRAWLAPAAHPRTGLGWTGSLDPHDALQ